MTIAITAPTGNVGSHLLRLLVEAGERPVVLARHPEKIPAELREKARVEQGDQGDAEFVAQVTQGVDALYWIDPGSDDLKNPLKASARMAESVSRAVRGNGIPRVVFQSSEGAERRGGMGVIDGLARHEEALDATGADAVHLRCGYFFSNLLLSVGDLCEGVLRTNLPPDLRQPWVAPVDIAGVALAALREPAGTGDRVRGVYGPEDLSFADVVRILTHALGREIRLLPQSDEETEAALLGDGLTYTAAEANLQMTRGVREGLVPDPPRDARSTTPTTLAEWAAAELRPAIERA